MTMAFTNQLLDLPRWFQFPLFLPNISAIESPLRAIYYDDMPLLLIGLQYIETMAFLITITNTILD